MMGPKKFEMFRCRAKPAQISRKGGIQSIEILSEEIDGQAAEVGVRQRLMEAVKQIEENC